MRLASNDRRRLAARRVRACLAVLAVTLLAAGCVTVRSGDGGGFLTGGRIHIREGEVARDDIVMLGGSVRIDGETRRDVVVIGGSLTVNGVANGVVNIAGTARIGPDARIRGDLVNVGGSMSRSPGAQVDGEYVNVGIGGFDFVPWFGGFGSWSWGSWWGISPFHVAARTTQFIYWLLLGVLTAALAADRVSSTAHSIKREPFRLGAIGFVGFFALGLMTLFLFVLSLLIIGIPFLLALLLGWWLAYIFGMVSVFQVVGEKLLGALGKSDASQLGLVLAGGGTLGVIHFFPFVGPVLWWLAAFVGLGAVFATRFGANRPWLSSPDPAPPAPYTPPPSAPSAPPAATMSPFAQSAAAPAPDVDVAAAGDEVAEAPDDDADAGLVTDEDDEISAPDERPADDDRKA